MGCFSYKCQVCGKGVLSSSFSGEQVKIFLLQDGKVIQQMEGEYDSYGVPDCSDDVVFFSLEEFMNRDKPKIEEVDKMQEIMEMKARIKYYIDEIDMFTPRRK